jgi:2-polyprenyl-6-methoxyphenol hydroxylase-like FAD-dependent oxidoreductase
VPFSRYGVYSHTGRSLREDPLGAILDRYGDYRGIGRGDLIATLAAEGCAVAFDSTVVTLAEHPDAAAVTVRSGDREHQLEFDLVIIADGMDSGTRDFVLGGRPVQVVDTHWGGWVVWAPEDANPDLGDELWGVGAFLGMYPVPGEIGVFLGGPRADTAVGPARFVEQLRRRLTDVSPRVDRALAAVVDDPDPYYWSLTDCRADAWTTGHTVLVGDAAAGFLPTAGIGAGMAIESAWVLTRMLRHTDRPGLRRLLEAYETAQRPRVEAAQDNSRLLARLMFHRSRALAVLRDLAMRVVSVESALKPIQRLLAEQPDPDALAAAALPGVTPKC